MAQIRPVTSEALEAQIRALLPSQNGFGEDLQASNVITPIIDLTAAAQGTTTPDYLQLALSFDSVTAHDIANNTVVIANTPGFYRIFGSATATATSGNLAGTFQMSDGLANKFIWQANVRNGSGATMETYDFIVFLGAGDSISGISSSLNITLVGVSRQIADVNGNLTYPSPFSPQ